MKIKLDPGAYMPEREHTTDAKKHNDEWFNCTCPICGKKFHLKPYNLNRSKKHYCSQKCHYEAKKEYMRGEGNHQYGLRGSKNASWKSDRKLTDYKYIAVRCLDHPFSDKHGWVFEHRLIAEKFLLTNENSIEIKGKKYLSPEYEVHHKNFDRQDNRPENLEVLKRGEHRRIHNNLNSNKRDGLGRYVGSKESIKVKRVTETAIIPERKSVGAAGYDLYVDSDRVINVPPHETVLVQSNIAFEIPKDYFGAVYARSGIATKMGLRPATCVSVIDSDYRGSVGLPIHNDTDMVKDIQPYERVAQIIFQKAITPELELVDELTHTERGDNGFGSSGR